MCGEAALTVTQIRRGPFRGGRISRGLVTGPIRRGPIKMGSAGMGLVRRGLEAHGGTCRTAAVEGFDVGSISGVVVGGGSWPEMHLLGGEVRGRHEGRERQRARKSVSGVWCMLSSCLAFCDRTRSV